METLFDYFFTLSKLWDENMFNTIHFSMLWWQYLHKSEFSDLKSLYFLNKKRIKNDEPIIKKNIHFDAPFCELYLEKMSRTINCGGMVCALTVEQLYLTHNISKEKKLH